jgi:hypothetical protein
MPYLSYLTEHCKSSAKTYGLLEVVNNLASKIEKDQSIQQWDKFLPTPYIKKDLGKSYRMVCAQQTVNDDTVIISFLECFARGGDGVYEYPACCVGPAPWMGQDETNEGKNSGNCSEYPCLRGITSNRRLFK